MFSGTYERTGAPVMRPLFYLRKSAAHISDARLEDEFLIGGNVIVAPVLEQGAGSREVVLPKGEWYSPLTTNGTQGKTFRFAHKITGVPPVFFKEASLIPQFRSPVRQVRTISTSQAQNSRLSERQAGTHAPLRIPL